MRKLVLEVELEKTLSSAQEREPDLMSEIDKLKKRIREMEVPFEERKTFQSGYSRSQRDKIKCFSCSQTGNIARIFFSKDGRNSVSVKTEKGKKIKNEHLKETLV